MRLRQLLELIEHANRLGVLLVHPRHQPWLDFVKLAIQPSERIPVDAACKRQVTLVG